MVCRREVGNRRVQGIKRVLDRHGGEQSTAPASAWKEPWAFVPGLSANRSMMLSGGWPASDQYLAVTGYLPKSNR
jgi:hypothetical protein